MLKNGKTLESALAELAVYKKKTACKNDNKKYAYYKSSEYYERMVNVFGADGFTCDYGYEDMVTLPNGQCLIFISCRIDILDKEGRCCHFINGIASLEVEYSEKSGRYIGINNVGSNGQLAAFKAACKQLNIFNCLYDEEKDSNGNNNVESSKSNNTSTATGGNNKPVSGGGALRKTFYVDRKMEQLRIDSNTGKPVYVIYIHEVEGNIFEQKEKELILYPNQYERYANGDGPMWESFLETMTCGKSQTISVFCSVVKNNENSYVFKGF